MAPMDDPRTEPDRVGDERATLTGFLDYQRDTLAMKCAGLTAAQLRERAVPPSSLSLIGLVRHLVDVERSWFRNVLDGQSVPRHWPGEFDVADADPDEAIAVWQSACELSRQIVAAAPSLDVTGEYGEHGQFSLRWILTHMIEEYARHNGHADLIRERLDGSTGE